MTELATAVQQTDRSAEPDPSGDLAVPVVLLPREQEEAEPHESAVGEAMRPAWVGKPRERAHRPFFTELPTQGMLWLPRSRAGVATVVVTRRSGPAELGKRNAPSRWNLFWERGSLYEIDLGLHHTTFEVELPSAVDLFSFRAHVAVEWRVLDPVRVVKDHVCDIRQALAPALVSLLAMDTRHFTVNDVYEAERAVAAALRNDDIGLDYGITTTLRVQLSADPGAAEHAASRRELEQQIEIEDLRRTQRMRAEATDQDVVKAQIALYRDIISAGDVDQFALYLARHPSDAKTVIPMVREVRREDQRQVTDFLARLLESGAIDRWEVRNTVQTALDWLKESNDHFLRGGEARHSWQGRGTYDDRKGNSAGAPQGNGSADSNGSSITLTKA
jgi:hypothetical protein